VFCPGACLGLCCGHGDTYLVFELIRSSVELGVADHARIFCVPLLHPWEVGNKRHGEVAVRDDNCIVFLFLLSACS